jgi:hypothetical protein
MSIYNNEVDPNVLMWEKLEQERFETMGDEKFQMWMKELNVSQSYTEPTGKFNARDMNDQYDFKNYKFSF